MQKQAKKTQRQPNHCHLGITPKAVGGLRPPETKQIQGISKSAEENRTYLNQANEYEVRTKTANNSNHNPPARQPPGDLERVVQMAKDDRRTTTTI